MIGSRYSERIGILAGEFCARNFQELFEGVKALPWEKYINKHDEFPVTGSSLNSQLHSVPDCQSIIKKAVVERLKLKYKLLILALFFGKGLLKDKVSLVIDASGAGLHKRGYRPASNSAPIKETLAAALVKLSRLRTDGCFIDPFCGSGTLLIEAAALAMNMAPGLDRSFVAESWKDIDSKVFSSERERARSFIRRNSGFVAKGYDIDPKAVDLSCENARRAGVEACIEVSTRDIRQFAEPGPFGCVVCNPPYGQRLLDQKEAASIYQIMGRVFERRRGYSYGIITPEEDFEAIFGRKADKRRKLYNGMIRCQFYQYFK